MVEFSKNKKQKSINETNNIYILNISTILEISTRTPEIYYRIY